MGVKKLLSSTSLSYWYSLFAVVLIVGLITTAYAAVFASRNLKTSLIQRTETIAQLVPATTLTSLSGTRTDIGDPGYQQLKKHFVALRGANPDIRFIYILALTKGHEHAFFYVDSEEPESPDYSPPGQNYDEGIADIKDTYGSQASQVLPISRDRWGVWLSAFSPIFDAKGNIVGVLGMDVPAGDYYRSIILTAIVPLLATAILLNGLAWARRRAVQQQKYLDEKAFYLSFASHEIMSPLTGVAWILRYKEGDLSSVIPKIEQTITDVLGTVRDVLSLQSLDRLHAKQLTKEPIRPSELLDTLVNNLSIVSEEHGVTIQNSTPEADKPFSAPVDTLLFKRVLFNLLINAVKYSPKGGVVTALVQQSNTGWAVRIHNDGELSAEEQQLIFRADFRTQTAEQGKAQGTGLGLTLSKNIIERHNGKLEVVSSQGQGITFTVVMPKD
ncbi:MAG TPA: HAMP domain-containing sensor histidine kinase [Candidatus Saccharimonadales bacterium]|nr:HAMP domain-containing sensor histidine kinase [Candidatus Saccharimonadales bacterium]